MLPCVQQETSGLFLSFITGGTSQSVSQCFSDSMLLRNDSLTKNVVLFFLAMRARRIRRLV